MTTPDETTSNEKTNNEWLTLKQAGNTAFTSGDFLLADTLYCASLLCLAPNTDLALPEQQQTKTFISELHSNRCAALLSLKRFLGALDEAELALRLCPNSIKAWFRKGQALEGLEKFSEAGRAFRNAYDRHEGKEKEGIKKKIEEMFQRGKSEDDKSRVQRIDEFVKRNASVVGCPVMLSESMFDLEEEIGEGNYTSVYRVKVKATSEMFALKVVEKKKAERISLRHGNLRAEIRMERRLLGKFDCPGIVKLLAYFSDASNIYFLEEYVNGKELWSHLKIRPPLELESDWPGDASLWGLCGLYPSHVAFFTAQILEALAYLEEQGVIHRDLKPENVMLQHDEKRGTTRVKLIDFGTARDSLDLPPLPEEEEEILPKRPGADRMPGSKPHHFVGTPEFMSPEATDGKVSDHRSDLWSLGCTTYQLLTGRTPFRGASEYLTFQKAMSGMFYVPVWISSPMRDLLTEKLLKVDRNERAQSAAGLRSHPAFQNQDFASFRDKTREPELPIPTLLELCVEQIGNAVWIETEAQGEGPLSRIARKRKKIVKENAVFAISKSSLPCVSKLGFGSPEWELVKGYLEQRSVVSAPAALATLYPDKFTSKFARVESLAHSFTGLSYQEESNWSEPYVVVVIVVGGEEDRTTTTTSLVAKVNAAKPRLVLLDGNPHAFAEIRDDVPVVCLSRSSSSQGRYFSFWAGAVLYIVLETVEFDADQAKWFERELLLGKFQSRYVVIWSCKAWIPKAAKHQQEVMDLPDEDGLVARPWRRRFVGDMQEAGVHVILTPDFGGRFGPTSIRRATELGVAMQQFETRSIPEQVRVLRVAYERVTCNTYTVEELPDWFFVESMDGPPKEKHPDDMEDEEEEDSDY